MEIYLNHSGRSGIYGYDIGDYFIVIYFSKGSEYKWTYDSTGEDNVNQMKELARSGSGLNSFINNNCKDDYEQ